MSRVGHDQLRILMMTASPFSILVTEDRASRGLVKRGLLSQGRHGGMTITADGLRVLADQMDAGAVADKLAELKAEHARKKLR